MKKNYLGKIVLLFLLVQLYSSNADETDGTRIASCKANSTIPKLQTLMEASVQKVLTEFGFDKNQTTEACECPECPELITVQECPLGTVFENPSKSIILIHCEQHFELNTK